MLFPELEHGWTDGKWKDRQSEFIKTFLSKSESVKKNNTKYLK